jgi:hypothetical protein
MKKSDTFFNDGNLIIAIKIDPSPLYVRVVLNLFHCSILLAPESDENRRKFVISR